jgi:hypothetical protein
MRHISTDDLRVVHVVSTKPYKAECGREVGPVEYAVNADDMQVVQLLSHAENGCKRCATILMRTKHIKASETTRRNRG